MDVAVSLNRDAGERMKNLKTKLERANRADRYFAVASIALMIFMVVAGFGAWMFGNPVAAAVDQPARHSTIR
jgi:hypothetical protein